MADNIMDTISKFTKGTDKKSKGEAQFFGSNSKKGEVSEFKTQLASSSKDEKKNGVKRVIAAMTIGKDVQELFIDVLNCIQTDDLELKKLVYLYVINYADVKPDLALMAVSTFTKDCADRNPLIRALAVRTMGCIRVDKICEYLFEPLRAALRDEDPYVRKTAALCTAKLYDLNPSLVEEQGFIDELRELISDANPTVVANAVAALSEIQDLSGGKDIMQTTTAILGKLLAALNECTEWGQIFILDSLAKYTPSGSHEAESIIERVTARLNHGNSAVVLSAVKIIMNYMTLIDNSENVRTLQRKIGPPLITLLSNENPEIQYVALRNINVIVQKRPDILSHEIKVFFCKYNDPLYVKMEKIEILVRLAKESNIEQLLNEFKEYAQEVDVDFVRKSVRAIGRCAIKIERGAERCIGKLLALIQSKVNYVVQETVIVVRDIFRKYPNKYESIIAPLCENLDSLDEPEAKAAMIWIIGEYAERMDNADELLERFVENFKEETAEVQLSLLTAVVKVFLKNPSETKAMVQGLLKEVTTNCDNPDLRDRGYIYWRLLSADPEVAKSVVLAEKPVIASDINALGDTLLDKLVANLSSLSTIYFEPPETFVKISTVHTERKEGVADDDEEEDDDDDDDDEEEEEEEESPKAADKPSPAKAAAVTGDLLGDIFGGSPAPAAAPTPSAAVTPSYPLLVDETKGQGVTIYGSIIREDNKLSLALQFNNNSAAPLDTMNIQFNKNTFGLQGKPSNKFDSAVKQGGSGSLRIPIIYNKDFANPGAPPSLDVQAAMQNANGTNAVYYFNLSIPFYALFNSEGKLEDSVFIKLWTTDLKDKSISSTVSNLGHLGPANVKKRLGSNNYFFIAERAIGADQQVLFFNSKSDQGQLVLYEVTLKDGINAAKVVVRADNGVVAQFAKTAIESLLTTK